jgi:hypothetical protein
MNNSTKWIEDSRNKLSNDFEWKTFEYYDTINDGIETLKLSNFGADVSLIMVKLEISSPSKDWDTQPRVKMKDLEPTEGQLTGGYKRSKWKNKNSYRCKNQLGTVYVTNIWNNQLMELQLNEQLRMDV